MIYIKTPEEIKIMAQSWSSFFSKVYVKEFKE